MSISIPLPWGLGPRRLGWSRPWLVGRRRHRAQAAGTATQVGFGGGDDQPAEWVTIYVARGLEEAYVVSGRLQAEDIPAIVANQALTHLYGAAAVWGVEVRVPVDLEERARAVLEA
jgi:hypothetical protein